MITARFREEALPALLCFCGFSFISVLLFHCKQVDKNTNASDLRQHQVRVAYSQYVIPAQKGEVMK